MGIGIASVHEVARGVEALALLHHLSDQGTFAALVARTPEEHAGVVAVAQHQFLHTLQIHLAETLVVGNILAGMSLVACLVDDVEAILVGQLQVFVNGRIVRGAHGVEVVLLQYLHIAADGLFVHGVSQFGMLHVGVGGVHLDGLSVQEEGLVADLGLLESHLARDLLHHGTRLAQQFQLQSVEHGRLAGPLVGIGDERRELYRLLPLAIHRETVGKHLLHFAALCVGQRGAHGVSATSVLIFLHVDRHSERGIAVLVVEVGGDIPVEESRLGRGIERHIVADACQAPVVLSLEVVAVAVFQHAHGQHVLAGLHIGRHVVLGRLLSAFVVAHLLPVYPHERAALHLLHTKEHLLSLPFGGQGERLAIGSRGVVLAGHIGRISLERSRHIAELRVAIALHLPIAGHLYGSPFAVLEVRCKELLRHFLGRFDKQEAPRPVERQVVGSQIVGVALLLAFLEDRGVLDVVIHVLQILSTSL